MKALKQAEIREAFSSNFTRFILSHIGKKLLFPHLLILICSCLLDRHRKCKLV